MQLCLWTTQNELYMLKGSSKFCQLLQLGQKRRSQVAVKSALMMLFAAHPAPPLHSAMHQQGFSTAIHALVCPEDTPSVTPTTCKKGCTPEASSSVYSLTLKTSDISLKHISQCNGVLYLQPGLANAEQATTCSTHKGTY